MTTKRLIRFNRGPLAGEFRYVAERSGCVTGPSGTFGGTNLNFPGEDDPWTREPMMQAVTYPSNGVSLTCAEKQALDDAAARGRADGVPGEPRAALTPPAFKTMLEIFA